MKEKYGGIDVLVNNAAIAFKQVGNNITPEGDRLAEKQTDLITDRQED